jgi:hypothetical protein
MSFAGTVNEGPSDQKSKSPENHIKQVNKRENELTGVRK